MTFLDGCDPPPKSLAALTPANSDSEPTVPATIASLTCYGRGKDRSVFIQRQIPRIPRKLLDQPLNSGAIVQQKAPLNMLHKQIVKPPSFKGRGRGNPLQPEVSTSLSVNLSIINDLKLQSMAELGEKDSDEYDEVDDCRKLWSNILKNEWQPRPGTTESKAMNLNSREQFPPLEKKAEEVKFEKQANVTTEFQYKSHFSEVFTNGNKSGSEISKESDDCTRMPTFTKLSQGKKKIASSLDGSKIKQPSYDVKIEGCPNGVKISDIEEILAPYGTILKAQEKSVDGSILFLFQFQDLDNRDWAISCLEDHIGSVIPGCGDHVVTIKAVDNIGDSTKMK